jgi:hypothetical protein
MMRLVILPMVHAMRKNIKPRKEIKGRAVQALANMDLMIIQMHQLMIYQ